MIIPIVRGRRPAGWSVGYTELEGLPVLPSVPPAEHFIAPPPRGMRRMPAVVAVRL